MLRDNDIDVDLGFFDCVDEVVLEPQDIFTAEIAPHHRRDLRKLLEKPDGLFKTKPELFAQT
jgi:hypothetical protein